MKLTQPQIEILYKLWRNRCFGKGHMLIDNVVKGFPKHQIDEFKANINDLIRKGILLRKPSQHGMAVCINNEMRVKIREELKEHYDFI